MAWTTRKKWRLEQYVQSYHSIKQKLLIFDVCDQFPLKQNSTDPKKNMFNPTLCVIILIYVVCQCAFFLSCGCEKHQSTETQEEFQTSVLCHCYGFSAVGGLNLLPLSTDWISLWSVLILVHCNMLRMRVSWH